jgi:hypothetical protein
MVLVASMRSNGAIWTDAAGGRIVGCMEQRQPCALCGDAIDSDQAWMANEMDGGVAHAGCVYRDEHEPERRERWQPSEIAEARTPDATRDLTRP